MVKTLKALASPIRLRIIALCSQRPHTGRELRSLLGISKPLLIMHIKKLIGVKLLRATIEVDEKRGIIIKHYSAEKIDIKLDNKQLTSILEAQDNN